MFSANTPIQYALAEVLLKPEHYLKLNQIFESKRNILREGLAASRFEVLPCRGGFFQLVRFSHFNSGSDMDMVKHLIADIGVGGIPTGAFYAEPKDTGLIRFTFARDDETLRKAAERLKQV